MYIYIYTHTHIHTHINKCKHTHTHIRFLASGGGTSNGVYHSMQVLAFVTERALHCSNVPLECSAHEHAAIQDTLRDMRDSMAIARKVAAAVENRRCVHVHANICIFNVI